MKNLRNCYAAFLLFALLSVSAAAPAQTDLQQKLGRISTITETRPLESTRFSEKYVT
ncbi:MAG: aminopeptidase, partial [Bacteroides uniformis]